jgi:hypothetical protein
MRKLPSFDTILQRATKGTPVGELLQRVTKEPNTTVGTILQRAAEELVDYQRLSNDYCNEGGVRDSGRLDDLIALMCCMGLSYELARGTDIPDPADQALALECLRAFDRCVDISKLDLDISTMRDMERILIERRRDAATTA